MQIVTHNIKHTLTLTETRTCVRRALSTNPQVVGFQEINAANDGAMKFFGEFIVVNDEGVVNNKQTTHKKYWICRGRADVLPVMLRVGYVKKFEEIKTVEVAPKARGVRPTPGTVVNFVNRWGREISLLNTHPLAHHDQPGNQKAFDQAAEFCNEFVTKTQQQGRTPMILMDGNGLRHVEGVSSCWDGHRDLPTGPGGATIDMIFTERCSDDVHTFATLSDHDGVVATYEHFH